METIYEKQCLVCGHDYKAKRYTSKTCSQVCRNILYYSRRIAGYTGLLQKSSVITGVMTPEGNNKIENKHTEFHTQLIMEEKINFAELPVEIQNKIREYESEKDALKPYDDSSEEFLSCLSLQIADDIFEWIEKDPKSEPPGSKPPNIVEAIKAKAKKDEITEADLYEILGRKPEDVELFGNSKISKLAFRKTYQITSIK